MAEPNQQRKKKLFYWGWRVLRSAMLVYVIVLTLLYFLQSILIFPGRSTQGRPEANFIPPKGTELVKLTTKDGDQITALFGVAMDKDAKPLPDIANRPTMIYFYGNGMCLRDCLIEFQRFRMLGVNVLIPEYTGYGLSTGKASEQGCYATSETAYEYLLSRKDVNPNKIIAGGWSLGAAVAIDLAARKQVIGLVTFSAFTSMVDMAKRLYPFLPWPGLILAYRFESERKIATINCPVFLSHGKIDPLIPWQMTERLASTAKGSKTTFYIDNADHLIFVPSGEKLFTELGKFLGRFQ